MVRILRVIRSLLSWPNTKFSWLIYKELCSSLRGEITLRPWDLKGRTKIWYMLTRNLSCMLLTNLSMVRLSVNSSWRGLGLSITKPGSVMFSWLRHFTLAVPLFPPPKYECVLVDCLEKLKNQRGGEYLQLPNILSIIKSCAVSSYLCHCVCASGTFVFFFF